MQRSGDLEARLHYFMTLSETPLFIPLEQEPQGSDIEPLTFETEQGRFILGFDTELRLSSFVGKGISIAKLTGRALAALAGRQNMGLALNPDVAPSANLLSAAHLNWLTDMLKISTGHLHSKLKAILPPQPHILPQTLLKALDSRLAKMTGMARAAFLVLGRYEDDTQKHILAFMGAPKELELILAQMILEMLVFYKYPADMLDVSFLAHDDALIAKFQAVGLRFDLPQAPQKIPLKAPGSDPQKPPILR